YFDQDLLQIGDKEFYFLLPVRSILGGPIGPRHHLNYSPPSAAAASHHCRLPPPVASFGAGKKAGRARIASSSEYWTRVMSSSEYFGDECDEDDGGDRDDDLGSLKKMRRGGDGHEMQGIPDLGSGGKGAISGKMGE
ncbi:hypothetical protein U1Q18_020330, partial [Sarracenia purpurea var. burkii]